jgi:hypothetical protein
MPNRLLSFLLSAALATSACTAIASSLTPDNESSNGPVSFALIGDMPYSPAQYGQIDRLIADINSDAQVKFVLHVGDVKGGGERCDDALLVERHRQLQALRAALVYTPGDNEWTDCHRTSNGSYLPTERLAFLRQLFFADPTRSGGQRTMAVQPQSALPGFGTFVENAMFVRNRVVFATVHVVGSNNNLAPWSGYDNSDTLATPRADRIAEFNARQAAALAWIDRVFDTAEGSGAAGVLISMQANPLFELASSDPARSGFNAVLAKLKARALAFAKPVVLAHGDFHEFVVDMPLSRDAEPGPRVRHFTRVQGFGSPRLHWVKVTADPKSANVFGFEPRLVPGNP